MFKFPKNSRSRAAAKGAAGVARHRELLREKGTGKVNARSKGAGDQTLVTCNAKDDFVSPSLRREGYCFFNKALNRHVT